MKVWKLACSIIILNFSNSVCASILHYSDWETGGPYSYTPVFGSTEIVSPTGTLSGNSLAFNTSGNAPNFYYDQIRYRIPSSDTSYYLGFDIYTESLIGSNNQFSILFDTPITRSLTFTKDGSIEANAGQIFPQILSTYNENESMHIDMVFNIGDNGWDIAINNLNIYSGTINDPFNPHWAAEYLSSIRFSQGLRSSVDSPSHNATVYLDNVVISTVPIPAAGWLFTSGFLGLLGMAARRKS